MEESHQNGFDHDGHEDSVDVLAMPEEFFDLDSLSESKSSWPELVGVEGKVAEATIQRDNPSVNVIIVPEGSYVILDVRCDRVWVWVDRDGIVFQEEVVIKTELFEKTKVEAQKCLAQSEVTANVRVEFEREIYSKFLGVLNSKKAKLREFRDQLSKQDNADKSPQEEEDAEKTESFDEESDYDKSDEDPKECITSSSKGVGASKRSRPRRARLT